MQCLQIPRITAPSSVGQGSVQGSVMGSLIGDEGPEMASLSLLVGHLGSPPCGLSLSSCGLLSSMASPSGKIAWISLHCSWVLRE